MERADIIAYIKANKPTYKEIDFSWHSDEELAKIKEIVDTEIKLSSLETDLEKNALRSGPIQWLGPLSFPTTPCSIPAKHPILTKYLRDPKLLLEVGQRVRKARLKKKFSQEKLAGKAGIAVSQIGRIERGKLNFSISTLGALSKALGVSPNDLFGK